MATRITASSNTPLERLPSDYRGLVDQVKSKGVAVFGPEASAASQTTATQPTSFPAEDGWDGVSEGDDSPESLSLGSYQSTLEERREFLQSTTNDPELQKSLDYARPRADDLFAAPKTQSLLSAIAPEDVYATYMYTTQFHKEINGALRSHDEGALRRLEPTIKGVASVLASLPPTAGTVYRGVERLTPERDAKYAVGNVVTEEGFTSTATTASSGLRFAGVMNDEGEMRKRSETPRALFIMRTHSGKAISQLSNSKEEAEVLFPPGTQFKVVDKTHDETHNLSIIYLDELG
jgi:hypothetical protein